ncbi:hypothetical protein KP509_18G044500 [Ceratopteris richardii]|uniref:Uncharacterized protein n=1 Tax=Ceratopteris richardii TaxID=49495 RepID=A0A8T2SPZ0_CERRI|nr:hypothetical protein KP509_18G044500 [Ceratopteris richardii]
MVVPLKLTQFYGHSVPRPRIYSDVKLNDHRVDPPVSVNDALLCWASEAHWSMGGLSLKRSRAQGRVEGSVRKLREFEEDEDDASPVKSAKRSPDGNAKPKVPPEVSRTAEKKRRADEELVAATPARKLRKMIIEDHDDDDTPAFVPATEERLSRKVLMNSNGASKLSPSQKKPLKSPSKVSSPEAVTIAPVSGSGRKPKLVVATRTPPSASKSGNSNLVANSTPAQSERLTRSAKKVGASPVESPGHTSRKSPHAKRKVVVPSDGESSDSDYGYDDFLKKVPVLRRSSRLVRPGESPLSVSDFD